MGFFSLAIIYRILFNIFYIYIPDQMCQFANSNPGAFAFLQSTTYLFGEAFPIMLIFLLQMLEIRSIKQKRSSKNKKSGGLSE